MASSTEIVRYLHQISRQQQKFMEQLDTLNNWCVEWATRTTAAGSGQDSSHPVCGPESDPISGQQDSGPI